MASQNCCKHVKTSNMRAQSIALYVNMLQQVRSCFPTRPETTQPQTLVKVLAMQTHRGVWSTQIPRIYFMPIGFAHPQMCVYQLRSKQNQYMFTAPSHQHDASAPRQLHIALCHIEASSSRNQTSVTHATQQLSYEIRYLKQNIS